MGKDDERQLVGFTRPRSRSLEDFKAWINGLLERLGGDPNEDDMTEAEWESAWREFWQDKEHEDTNHQQEG